MDSAPVYHFFANNPGTSRSVVPGPSPPQFTPGSERFSQLYKKRNVDTDQNERRNQLLAIQKEKRKNTLYSRRGIVELVEDVVGGSEDTESRNSGSQERGYREKRRKSFKDQLMFSEWMQAGNVPIDLQEEWCVMPCPKGKRVLVVAVKGRTKSYDKYGKQQEEFLSVLPGGRPGQYAGNYNQCTVLDCVFSSVTESFYILDMLAWGNQPFTDCEAEFRYFWLTSRIAEYPDMPVKQRSNTYPFILAPRFDCTVTSMSALLSVHPAYPNNRPMLDGLLFYHKKALYTNGTTPLVLWLLPFMVPEVLGKAILINAAYIAATPEQYKSQSEFIEAFQRKQEKKNKLLYKVSRVLQTDETSMDHETSMENHSRRQTESLCKSYSNEEFNNVDYMNRHYATDDMDNSHSQDGRFVNNDMVDSNS